MEVPSELHRETQREFWAAEQSLMRLIRKLESLKGWRASMARDAAWQALGGDVRLSDVGGVPSSVHAVGLQALARSPT
jgi:hypothetical protein